MPLHLQEQGLGGTMYDRDTIMKKYMNGYDGEHLSACSSETVYALGWKACLRALLFCVTTCPDV